MYSKDVEITKKGEAFTRLHHLSKEKSIHKPSPFEILQFRLVLNWKNFGQFFKSSVKVNFGYFGIVGVSKSYFVLLITLVELEYSCLFFPDLFYSILVLTNMKMSY